MSPHTFIGPIVAMNPFGSLLAQAMLVSFWKPVLLFVPFVAWAWFVAGVMDKHAARFYLERTMWNVVHLVSGLVALAAALLLPVEGGAAFWAALGVVVVLLGGDVLAFALVTNRDDRVPEKHKLRLDLSAIREARQARKDAKRAGRAELEIRRAGGELLPVPDSESPEFALRLSAEKLVLDAIASRAAQVFLKPAKENVYALIHLIDGVAQPPRSMPAADALRVINFWKDAAGLDVEDHRRRLVGDAKVTGDGTTHEIRVTTSGGQAGLQMAMRFDPAASVRVKQADMGLLPQQNEELDAIVADPSGVVLLVSPPAGGRTTTFYAMLRRHDPYTQMVQSIETDPQDQIEGVGQNRFDPYAEGPDYATLVRSTLRRDPDVVGIAELPDAETARNIVRSDLERSRVYVSMRAEGAIQAIGLWTKYVGNPEEASDSLHGVIAQKLVRRLCTNCRVPYQPGREMLAKLGLPADKIKQLFKKGGQVLIKNKPEVCPACQGIGYFGQIGIFEVYHLGDAERQAIKSGDANALRTELRKRQLPTMQQAALRHAVEGITSIEEILRVSGERGGAGGRKSASRKSPENPAASPSPA